MCQARWRLPLRSCAVPLVWLGCQDIRQGVGESKYTFRLDDERLGIQSRPFFPLLQSAFVNGRGKGKRVWITEVSLARINYRFLLY